MQNLLILMVILNACTTASYNKIPKLNLPEMPIAGDRVASELVAVCDKIKCPNTNNWLNELYLFSQQYNVYREELKK